MYKIGNKGKNKYSLQELDFLVQFCCLENLGLVF